MQRFAGCRNFVFFSLAHRHRKFVGVTTDIHTTRGDTKTIQTSATSFLVPPPSLLSPPHSLTNDSDNFTSSLEQAESLIQQGNPSDALTLCRELIQRYSENPDYDVVLAWAHLIAGRAILEEVALSRPVLLEELWGEAVSVSVQQRRRRGRGGGRRGAKGVGWLALIPEPFQEALDHFCTSLQLCHPSCPPQPLREVSTIHNSCAGSKCNMHTVLYTCMAISGISEVCF